MRQYFKAIIVVLCFTFFATLAMAGSTTVRGYTRKNGTYVESYQRTTPDSSRTNNYSYPGNYNPNTDSYTPRSNSPRENYPSNPNPYDKPTSSSSGFGNYNSGKSSSSYSFGSEKKSDSLYPRLGD